MEVERKKEFQLRFSHYLKSYRCANDLTQEQLANQLGVTKILVSKYESVGNIENRLISCIEFLDSFAKLEKSTISEFVSYLDDNGESQNLYWSDRLFKACSHLDASVQFGIVSALSDIKSEKETVTFIFKTALSLLTVNEKQRETINNIIHMAKDLNEGEKHAIHSSDRR